MIGETQAGPGEAGGDEDRGHHSCVLILQQTQNRCLVSACCELLGR